MQQNGDAARYRLLTGATILFAGILYALLGHLALHDYPYSGDEYSMYLQAEGFARGVLEAPAPPHADWLAVDHVVIDDFVRSKYPPGTAALLSLGMRAGVPNLVTPLEAALALLFTWLAVRLALGERRAFWAVAFLAAMPLFTYEAATYLSHTATLLFTAIGAFAVAVWARRKNPLALVGFGAACGGLFLVRPIEAILLGLALAVLRNFRALLVAGLSALPFLALALAYNKLQFGGYFIDGYHAYLPAFVALYGADGATRNISLFHVIDPKEIYNHLMVVESFLIQWTIPGAALIAVLGARALRQERANEPPSAGALDRFLLALTVLFLGTLFVTYVDVDDSPRPRYLSMVLLPLAYFAAAGWSRTVALVREQLGARGSAVVAALVWMAPIFQIGSYLEHRVPEVAVHLGLPEALAREHVDSGVVLVRAEWPARYARNGMFFEHRPLLLSAPASVTGDDVAAKFPGQPVYEAIEPHGGSPWRHGWIIKRLK